jgi:hypothetical protein
LSPVISDKRSRSAPPPAETRDRVGQTRCADPERPAKASRLLAFYGFPAEHWIHLRTTNPIESTFATVRHRTTRTKNCVSRAIGLAFKLVQEAEKSWLAGHFPLEIQTETLSVV